MMYRFHPSVRFRARYPSRERIVEEVTTLWERYHLDGRTSFNVSVENVWKDGKTGKWVVNDESYGIFDGVIAAVGTCGKPKMPSFPGRESFKGSVYHSSQLNGTEEQVHDKKVAIIGGGASSVEAVEFAVAQKAREIKILARSAKWIIPRNPIVDVLLAAGPIGEETELSWIPESLLKRFFYRDLADLAPSKAGLFTETPMCNDLILEQIRSGRVSYLRGDIHGLFAGGVEFSHRSCGVPKGGPGKHELVRADTLIMATGFQRPSLSFLPEASFQKDYLPPNWYLQTFPIGEPTICANNCTYIGAIGTVGNVHIGIYTRMLLMFITDPATRPSDAWMRVWVDSIRVMKQGTPSGALDFFTYAELLIWFVLAVILHPRRWVWAPFILAGWGKCL